jgi:hypothetical protein
MLEISANVSFSYIDVFLQTHSAILIILLIPASIASSDSGEISESLSSSTGTAINPKHSIFVFFGLLSE